MTLAYSEAADEMLALFKAAWEAGSGAIAGYIPEVRWPGVEKTAKPDSSKFWVRVSLQGIKEGQATLSNCVGLNFKKRYEAKGLIFVQLFCPKSLETAVNKGRFLATVARNAFRGKTTAGGVIFRHARFSELPQEELFHRFNIVAEYEFDEIG